MADQPDPKPAALVAQERAAAREAPAAGTAPTADEASAGAIDQEAHPNKRRRLLLMLLGAVAIVALLVTAYHFLIGVKHASTDNAYVGADTASVTPLVAGQVRDVRVQNTQMVHKGDILVVIDPVDAQIAADQAAAQLAQIERQLTQTRATGGSLQAQLDAKTSDIARARAERIAAQAAFDKARIDLDRRNKLSSQGAVSGDEITIARNNFAAAQSQLAVAASGVAQAEAQAIAARQSYAANQALTEGSDYDNPDVRAARAKLAAMKLDLSRTVIRAPIDGIVAQRNVQVGQRVAPGTQIMTVVPVNSMYVDANFKEGQLRKVKIGQPATLHADIYGGDVTYHGKVVGLAGGTGSAFALIPAQNATGNWIKVVQRLPTRIALDPKELEEHPLRVGLSMDVDVDVSQ